MQRGFTRSEILIIIVCLAIIVAIAATTLGPMRATAKQLKDGTNLSSIHRAMMLMSSGSGMFPIPGLVDRLPVDSGDGIAKDVPGRGPEDISQNTTASFYSLLIAPNAIQPSVLISPFERNPLVRLIPQYDYDAYNPQADTFWDPRFAADLQTGANVSYAHMPIVGEWKARHWNPYSQSAFPLLGNRGPKNGHMVSSSFACDPGLAWAGYEVGIDGRVTFASYSKLLPDADDPFRVDMGEGRDAYLSFTRSVTESGSEYQHD